MVTEDRDLRSGTSLWLAQSRPRLRRDRLGKTDRFDVVVIGTGISGALVSDALLVSGLRVVALDRRAPMSGSTPASTALLQFELDTPLRQLKRKVGATRAERAWLRSAQAVQALGNRIRDLEIDCDWRERSTLYLPGSILDVAGLRQEARDRQKLNLRSQFVDREELKRMSGISAAGAIISHGNAEANPVKLTSALWRSFQSRGGKVVSPFEVAEVDETARRVRVTSAQRQHVDARFAVFCTGYEFPKFYKPKDLKVVSTWALATRQQPSRLWPNRYLIWQAADPYLYMRTTADGRVIAGGDDEDFTDEDKRDALTRRKIAAIARKASRILPKVDFDASHAWTGNFGVSETGMPVIGLMKGFKRCYGVMGFGGNGITFGMLAAELVSRAINGVADPDAEIFAGEK